MLRAAVVSVQQVQGVQLCAPPGLYGPEPKKFIYKLPVQQLVEIFENGQFVTRCFVLWKPLCRVSQGQKKLPICFRQCSVLLLTASCRCHSSPQVLAACRVSARGCLDLATAGVMLWSD
jgi:hypothetical protein